MTMEELKNQVEHNDTAISNIYTKAQVDKLLADSIENFNQFHSKIEKLMSCCCYWDVLNDKAKVPTKRAEDAGFDIYTTDDPKCLKPGETAFFGTGLKSAFSAGFWVEIKERGSTGAVGLSVRSGVIDSGYRGEWKIMLTNVNKFPVEFSADVDKITYVYGKIFKKKIKKVLYPLSKAIAQAVVVPLPSVICKAWEPQKITTSERGQGGWGASGK